MGFGTEQQLRDLLERVRVLEEQVQHIPTRFTSASSGGSLYLSGVADEFIAADGSGSVTVGGSSRTVTNLLSYPVWDGSTVRLDPGGRFIIQSNAATLIHAVYDGGTVTDPANYSSDSLANRGHYDNTGATVAVRDPGGYLTSATPPTKVVLATGADDPNFLDIISTEPIPGPPGAPGADGEDGEDGTGVAMDVITALVNDSGGAPSSTSPFNFDGGTALIGIADATGTAVNTTGRPLADNQKVILVREEGGSWFTVEYGINLLDGKVNQGGGVDEGDATFPFDEATAQLGTGPSSGTATNLPPGRYLDDQPILLLQINDSTWIPLGGPFNLKALQDYDVAEEQVIINDEGTVKWISSSFLQVIVP